MWADDKQVFQKIDVLDTPTGRIVNTILEANCQVGVSTRAEGDLEECEDDTRGKYSRVIPESYNYVTTDFTADPSTFGALPQDVKKNIVSAIGREYRNESTNPSEKRFAKKLLESMKCKKDKCVNCGCCKVLDEEKKVECESCKKLITQSEYADGQGLCPECLKVDAKESKMKIKNSVIKSNNVEENQTTVVVNPEAKTVDVVGDVKSVLVNPTPETDPNVTVTVVTSSEVTPPLAPQSVAPEAEVVVEPEPVAKEVSPEVEKELEKEVGLKAEEKPEEEEEKTEESKIPVANDSLVDEVVAGNILKDNKNVYFKVKSIDALGIALQPVEEGVEVIKFIEWDKVGGLGLVKVAETKVAEKEEIIGGPVIDETADIIAMYKAAGLPAPDGKGEHTRAFHKLAIEVAKGYVKSGDTPKEALDKAYPTAMKQLGRDKAVKKAHQRSESISITAKQIKDLRIKEAIVRAERDKLVDYVSALTDNDLEVKILLKKIRESKVIENDEVKALCSKLEEKARTDAELSVGVLKLKKEIDATKKQLQKLEKDLEDKQKEYKEALAIELDKWNGEHKKELENIQKDNEKKIIEAVSKSKDETIKAVVKEYVDLKLSDGLIVHDNVRALLENCTTLTEVNEALEKVRDSNRWSALHSQPLKEVVVNKPVDPEQASIGKRVGMVFNGFSNKG